MNSSIEPSISSQKLSKSSDIRSSKYYGTKTSLHSDRLRQIRKQPKSSLAFEPQVDKMTPTNVLETNQEKWLSPTKLPNVNLSKSVSTNDYSFYKSIKNVSTNSITDSRDTFERLSGLYNPQNSIQTLTDPNLLIRPVNLCVRCSNHASLCMPCTETLCDQGLDFYRKSRAKGLLYARL
jgi:hypothetical protein